MSKGIAVSTILYMLIGIIVVAIVVYMVYTYMVSPVLPETQCRGLATTWCTSCQNVDWSGGPVASDDLKACAPKYNFGTVVGWSCAQAKTFCNQFLPT